MTALLILSRLSRSLERLFDHDLDLFERGPGGVHEQTVTFRLGIYLQQEFPGLTVDCEYNRRGDDLKKRSSTGGLIKPDVVVHRRGVQKSNVLVIEAKKSLHWEAARDDLFAKIGDLTDPDGPYGYTLGMCWKLEPSRSPATHRITWFSRGKHLLETPVLGFRDAVCAKLEEVELEEVERAG